MTQPKFFFLSIASETTNNGFTISRLTKWCEQERAQFVLNRAGEGLEAILLLQSDWPANANKRRKLPARPAVDLVSLQVAMNSTITDGASLSRMLGEVRYPGTWPGSAENSCSEGDFACPAANSTDSDSEFSMGNSSDSG